MMSANQAYQYQQPMASVAAQPGQPQAANFQYANYAAQPQFAGYEQQAQAYYGQAYDYNQAAAAAAAAAGGAQAAVQTPGQSSVAQQQAGAVAQVPYSQSASMSQVAGGHAQAGQLAGATVPQFAHAQMAAYTSVQGHQAGHQNASHAGMPHMQATPGAGQATASGLEFQAYGAQAMGLMQPGHAWAQAPAQVQGAAVMGGVPQPQVAMLAPNAAAAAQFMPQAAAAAGVLQARSQLPTQAGAQGLAGQPSSIRLSHHSSRGHMRGRGGHGYSGDQRGGGHRQPGGYNSSRQLNDLGGMDPDAERPDTVLIEGLTVEDSTHENLLTTFQAAGQVKINDKSGMPMIWIFKQQGIPTGRALVSYIEHSSSQSAIAMFNGQNGWTVRLGKNSERPVIVQSNNSQQQHQQQQQGMGRGGSLSGRGGGGGFMNGASGPGGGKMRGGRGGGAGGFGGSGSGGGFVSQRGGSSGGGFSRGGGSGGSSVGNGSVGSAAAGSAGNAASGGGGGRGGGQSLGGRGSLGSGGGNRFTPY